MAYFNEFPYTRNYDADLGWLIRKVKKLLDCCATAEEQLEALNQFMQDIENGNFPESVVDAFKRWMNDNLLQIVGDLAKQVFFGLTTDGYFVAFIPESWDDIRFNTTEYDTRIPGFDRFGHLVLSY